MNILQNGELWLYGTVGIGVADGIEGFTSREVGHALAKLEGDVTVRVNSGGGWCDEGVAIYNILSAHPGKITIIVEGTAASAASVLAMAGDDIIIRPGAYFMVHEAHCIAMGTSDDLAKTIKTLDTINESMATIYASRTRRSITDIRREMAVETWMTADEAVSKRYATRVVDGHITKHAAFDWGVYNHTPTQLAAVATTARQSTGFQAAQARYAAARKAETDHAVCEFVREYCLGRENDPTALTLMKSLDRDAPAALARARELGPLDQKARQRALSTGTEIVTRHSGLPTRADSGWDAAIAKANKLMH